MDIQYVYDCLDISGYRRKRYSNSLHHRKMKQNEQQVDHPANSQEGFVHSFSLSESCVDGPPRLTEIIVKLRSRMRSSTPYIAAWSGSKPESWVTSPSR